MCKNMFVCLFFPIIFCSVNRSSNKESHINDSLYDSRCFDFMTYLPTNQFINNPLPCFVASQGNYKPNGKRSALLAILRRGRWLP